MTKEDFRSLTEKLIQFRVELSRLVLKYPTDEDLKVVFMQEIRLGHTFQEYANKLDDRAEV